MKKTPMEILKERLKEISYLGTISHLASWDQEVYMPAKASDMRARALSELSGILHNKFVALDADGVLTKLRAQLESKKIKGKDAVIVRETWRNFERERKLPEAFVKEMTEVTSKAQHVWAVARSKNDFKMFLPWLLRVVVLKRKEAAYVGFKDSPYDALLDSYEPGMATEEAAMILNDLKDFLIPFIKERRTKKGNTIKLPKGKFPLDKQIAFNTRIAEALGFDFEAGRLDASTHPFTSGFHPEDVRITTRYKEDDVLYAIGSTIHEAGHGIYEQGLPATHFGTPLAEALSLGIHESQSRMWENQIGKSLEFWQYFFPKLQKEFPIPFKKVKLADFYTHLNRFEPSLIRTESDEVTYNLHIVIRFEIEKELIEGSLDPKDLPAIWKEKMKEYLGIEVPNDALGVLQDVHWSAGLFGYFPTYSFGNLYAAQFYKAMQKKIPDVKKQIKNGKFSEIKEWLRKNIHAHGKVYSAGQLVKKVTGEDLNSRYFAEYLTEKYKN